MSDRRVPARNLLLTPPVSTARETTSSGDVYSIGEVRDLAWTRPCDVVSRLPRESRCSHGPREQQVSSRLARASMIPLWIAWLVLLPLGVATLNSRTADPLPTLVPFSESTQSP